MIACLLDDSALLALGRRGYPALSGFIVDAAAGRALRRSCHRWTARVFCGRCGLLGIWVSSDSYSAATFVVADG